MGATFVSFDVLLAESDFVIVSCSLTKDTTNLFDGSAFEKMKSTSVLVNVSHGTVVNTNALVEALKSGLIFAAGLDVVTPEPLPSDHPLLKLDNCGKSKIKSV